jgi:hypothetical protein
MNKWPQPFWAVLLAAMGIELAVVALFCSAEKDIKIAVIGLASSIVTGALGYIGGHQSKDDAPSKPTTPAEPA